jgi:5-(carboxyamino)imidazole ribonucleotide synthase
MLCGLPAGDANLISPVVMINLLGDVWGSSQPNWAAILKEPNVKLHLYGKKEARVGRKMGHYNVLSTDTASASALAETIFSQLQAD